MRRKREGFTLIELTVVMALAALLASIGVPVMHSLTTYGRRANELNRLRADLLYARSEAIARGMTVTLCTSPDGTVCNTHHPWDDGWIIFVDTDSDLDRDLHETLLRVKAPFASEDSLSGNRLVNHHVGYQRSGFLRGVHNGTITFSSVPDRDGLRRCLVISRTGRIRAVDGTDPLCDGN